MKQLAKYACEKLAQTKWRAYIDAASKSVPTLKTRAGELLSGSKVESWNMNRDVPYSVRETMVGLANNTAEAPSSIKNVKRYISSILNKQPEAYATIKDRKWRLNKLKWGKKGIREPYSGPDKDEYVRILHGGGIGRINRMLSGGGASYPTDVTYRLSNGRVSNLGMMVHSKRLEWLRMDHYASNNAATKMDQPGILGGRIQKKYLYHNNGYSGGGDEYTIPKIHLDKIQEAQIIKRDLDTSGNLPAGLLRKDLG